MRVALGRLVAAGLVVVGALCLLQLNDSAILSGSGSHPPAIRPPIVVAQASTGGREYYFGHEKVVPFGYAELKLPILMYHYVRIPPSPRIDRLGYNLSVSPATFTEQMDWLASHGYHTVTFNDVRLYWERIAPLPGKPVIITLDDGYSDLYTAAFPILQAHGFTAVAYIVSGFVGRRGYVTKDEILQMDHYGIEIGAHTVDHVNLAHTPQPLLDYQLVESRQWLEQLLGHPVLDMAYPSGRFDATVIDAVQAAGYWSATTEQFSILHTEADRYAWARVRVGGGEPMSMFTVNLGTSMPTVEMKDVNVTPVDTIPSYDLRPGY